MTIIRLTLFLCVVFFTHTHTAAVAQSPIVPPADDVLTVVGEQPGPGMWKVSKGNNVLWIMGTQTPLQQKMRWRAKDVKTVVAQAQEVLSNPSITVSIKQIGYFNALVMLPAAMEGRKNPDSATLKEIIPADVYARWLRLRDRYVDEFNTNDESADIERWRPVFAAQHLYSKAIQKSGMTNANLVWQVITDHAKLHNVKVTAVKLEPAIQNARAALKDFQTQRLSDLECFTKTVERIETDLDAMRARAKAWAVGDIDKLRTLPASDQRESCQNALSNTTFAKTLGAHDLVAQLETKWLDTAATAISKNAVTVAVLPINRLLAADGYLTKLRARGYIVKEPETE